MLSALAVLCRPTLSRCPAVSEVCTALRTLPASVQWLGPCVRDSAAVAEAADGHVVSVHDPIHRCSLRWLSCRLTLSRLSISVQSANLLPAPLSLLQEEDKGRFFFHFLGVQLIGMAGGLATIQHRGLHSALFVMEYIPPKDAARRKQGVKANFLNDTCRILWVAICFVV